MGIVPIVVGLFAGGEFKHHPLTLSQHAKQAAIERTWSEVDRFTVVLTDYHADTGLGVVHLHNALHGAGV